MRSIFSVMWYVFGLAALSFSHTFAADQTQLRPVSGGGFEVSLSTSGYSLSRPSTNPVPQQKRARASEAKTSFVASVTVKNRSRSPIPFSFTDNMSRWVFRILDSNDQEVWRSTNFDTEPVAVEEVLAPGKAWKETVQIPLVIDGQPLGVGAYSLQAFLKTNKSISASSLFEVVQSPGTQGIQGIVKLGVFVYNSNTSSSSAGLEKTGSGSLVLASGSYSGTIADNTLSIGSIGSISIGTMESVPAQQASVRVTQINTPAGKTPFTWEGRTDEEGRFEVNTPPGQFQVSSSGGSYPEYVFASNTIAAVSTIHNITVEPNQFRPMVIFSSPGCVSPVIDREPATN